MEVAQKTYICCYWKTYNMKEILVRTLSGVLYISIIIFAMFTSREWFMGLFFVLAVITLSEYLKLIHLTSYLAYLLLATAFYFLSYNVFADNAVYLLLILSGFVNHHTGEPTDINWYSVASKVEARFFALLSHCISKNSPNGLTHSLVL